MGQVIPVVLLAAPLVAVFEAFFEGLFIDYVLRRTKLTGLHIKIVKNQNTLQVTTSR